MDIAEQYQKERASIELNRSLDWSTFGAEYKVAGEPLGLMTVQTWFDLLVIDSPLITSDIPTVESLVDYIWRNSQRHTYRPLVRLWRLWRLERRIIKELSNKEDAEALLTITLEHVKNSVDEFPLSGGSGGNRTTNALSQYSGEASMVDEIANRYSLHPDEVLKMPLRKAFSLQRVIRVSTIPDYKILEPESLRAIKSIYLNKINNGKK